MRRVLIDVNVVLDVLLDRSPHAAIAARLWALIEKRRIEALLPAHGVTTLFYLAERRRDAAFAREVVRDLLGLFGIASVDDAVLRRALALQWADFEDAVCAAAAEAAHCTLLVTRVPWGFEDAKVPIVDPVTAIAVLDPGVPPTALSEPRPSRRRPRAAVQRR